MEKRKCRKPTRSILYCLFSILCLLLLTACGSTTVGPDAPIGPPSFTPPPVSTPTPMPSALTVADVVTERRALSCDIPDVIKVDISLPMVREDLPGAAEVNEQIAAHYPEAVTADPEEIAESRDNFGYPFYHLRYETYSFGDLFEICVIGEEYSLYGSGPLWWVTRYYYDAAEGRAATEAEFLETVGYTRDNILTAFREQAVMDEDATEYTYDDAHDCYYIDAQKDIHIWVSLYA